MEPKEFEIKLQLDPQDLHRLRKHPALAKGVGGPGRTRTLRSIYFDTVDHALKKAAISLRTRNVDRGWVQSVKIGKTLSAGISQPIELETPVSQGDVDLDGINHSEWRGRIKALCKGRPLQPVFETLIKRTTFDLHGPGSAVVELALDSGHVIAGDARQPLLEVEIELKHGTPQAVFHWACRLLGDLAFLPSEFSKAQQGYAFIAGHGPAARKPRKKISACVLSTSSCGEAVDMILRASATQIADNLAVVFDNDHPEGPHQLRVGLRRLRSGLKAFRPCLRGRMLQHFTHGARELGRVAGELRDADVLLADIVGPVDADMIGCGDLERMRARLQDHQHRTRAQVIAELRKFGSVRFVYELFGVLESQDWRPKNQQKADKLDMPVAEHAALALTKCWSTIEAFGARIEELSIPERHEMRKRLKELRYMTEMFGTAFPQDKVAPYLSTLKQLQDLFGYLNDVAMADKLPAIVRVDHKGQTETGLSLVAMKIVDWHMAHADEAWEKSTARWMALCETPPFWQ